MQISISFKKKSLLCAFIVLIHNASYSFTLSFHEINTKTAVMSIGIAALIIFFPTLRYYYNIYCLQHQLGRCFADRKSVAVCVNFYKQWRNGNKNLPILFFVGNQANCAFDCFSQYVTNFERKECPWDITNLLNLNWLRKISWNREKILFLIDNDKIDGRIDNAYMSFKTIVDNEYGSLNMQIEVCAFNNPYLSK